jgi:nucleotide-binding universal stress UspA family protein
VAAAFAQDELKAAQTAVGTGGFKAMPATSLPHFLVPTNFRPASRARQRALQLAVEQAARVTLLHVLPAPLALNRTDGLEALGLLHDVLELQDASLPIPGRNSEAAAERRRALERLLQELHPEWREAIPIEIAWRQGGVLEQILEHARRENVEAIILGWRRQLWPRFSACLAEQVLRKAPCEVILVSDSGNGSPGVAAPWTGWLRNLPGPTPRAIER